MNNGHTNVITRLTATFNLITAVISLVVASARLYAYLPDVWKLVELYSQM